MKLYALTMIWSIITVLFMMGCKKTEAPKISQGPSQTRISQEQPEAQEIESLLKELKKTNPFRPDHASGLVPIETEGGTYLKGIIWDAQKPFALIGDKVVSEGDLIDNKKVIKINKDSVVLNNNGQEEVLKLEVP